LNLILDN